ncbi:MAG: hypothetical protein ACREQP_07235 [Candidatus Binatia bacterium]
MRKSWLQSKRAVGMIAAAVIVFLTSLGDLQAQSATENPAGGLREFLAAAIDVQERHHNRLRTIPDVVGTAVGLTAEGRPAIKVYTKSAPTHALPASLDGVDVEIEETGEFHSLLKLGGERTRFAARAKRFARPVPIGVSTGNEGECSAGTIGARAKDSSGNVYALSNNHVYAMENAAVPNSAILQPGLFDTNCSFSSSNVLGTLSSFVPIVFSTSASNTVDAAIAASDVSLLRRSTPSGGYGTPRSATVAAFIGQRVKKYGRTTFLTSGRVIGINAIVLVDYDSGPAQFVDQIVVRSSNAFIRAGDSGSLLVTAGKNKPVGLLFAGSTNGRMAIANRIDSVLNAFGVVIDGK